MNRHQGRVGLERERKRRQELERRRLQEEGARSAETGNPAPPTSTSPGARPVSAMDETAAARATGVRLGGQGVTCGWCGAAVVVKARGPIPKWCSATCRHRAWEQVRAVRSGLVAEVIVDRPVVVLPRETSAWVDHLEALKQQIRSRGLELEPLRRAMEVVLTEIEHEEERRSTDAWW